MPSLTQLEYILAVADHRHFGKAALACHITQPTLSQQINKAEESLGLKIFDRDKKPVLVTPKGMAFIEQARAVLREHRKLRDLFNESAAELSGEFRVGVIPTVSSVLVPSLVENITEKNPKVDLHIEEITTEQITKKLMEDKLDIGILATPLKIEGLIEEPLYYETFKIFASQNHPLLERKFCKREHLDGADLWVLNDGHCFKNQVINYCAIQVKKTAAARNVHFQSNNLETLQRLIEKGHGYTLIPALMMTHMSSDQVKNQIRSFATPEPAREISIVSHRSSWKRKMIDSLRQSILANLPKDVAKTKSKNIEILGVS